MKVRITIVVEADLPSLTYAVQTYLPKEYPSLPDCITVAIDQVEDMEPEASPSEHAALVHSLASYVSGDDVGLSRRSFLRNVALRIQDDVVNETE